MTVNFITISLKQLSLSSWQKFLQLLHYQFTWEYDRRKLKLVVLTNYGLVFCLGWFFVFTNFVNTWDYVNTLLESCLPRFLERAHGNDSLKIKLNQFHGKSISDIAHEATHISKICAVNCRLSSNLLQDFSFQERYNCFQKSSRSRRGIKIKSFLLKYPGAMRTTKIKILRFN